MAQLTPRFSANRAVREYTEERYLPAAAAYRQRVANNGEAGRQIVAWKHDLDQKWDALHFGAKKVETTGDQHHFEVQVFLNDLDPGAVRIELYADSAQNGDPIRQEMQQVRPVAEAPGQLHLQRDRLREPSGNGLYGPFDTAPRGRCDPPGRRPCPMAAMIRTYLWTKSYLSLRSGCPAKQRHACFGRRIKCPPNTSRICVISVALSSPVVETLNVVPPAAR